MLQDIAKFAHYLPRYFELVFAILARPVSEVSARASEPDGLQEALLLWTISTALVIVTFYVAFGSGANETAYFVAAFLSSGASLILHSLAFYWSWKLFAAGAPLKAFVAATAYIWGAVLPPMTLLFALAIETTRWIGEDLHAWILKTIAGCVDWNSGRIIDIMPTVLDSGGAPPFFLLYGTIVCMVIALPAAYLVAFLRILRRLQPVSGAQFAAISVISLVAFVLALSAANAFHLSIFQGAGGCRPTEAEAS